MSRAARAAIVASIVALTAALAWAEDRTAHVTYVSGSTIYVDAGTDDGLVVGSVIEVLREGQVVARLVVDTVTAKRASASIGDDPREIRPGDLVRFAAVAPEPAPATPAPEPQTARPAAAGIRGRVGLRYLRVTDRTGLGTDFSQPALDLRLLGTQVGGAPIDFDVDFRPRRTYRTRVDGSSDDSSSDRLYSLYGAWRPGPFRIAAGRQMSPALGPIALLDGFLGEYRKPRFATGIFAGTEPDPVDWGYDSSTRDVGVYAEGTSAPGATTRFWINGGAITSTTEGEINRDLVYLAGRLSRAGFHGYLLQQVDVNRGWRKEAEGDSLTPSGTYVALRWQASTAWALQAGYDDRRNVRLYRDFVTPATEFDDSHRQGYWGGVDWRPGAHWLVGADARSSDGGDAGTADSYSLRGGVVGLTSLGLDVTARATHYTGPYLDGDLATLDLGLDLARRLRLGVHGGIRDETANDLFGESTRVDWLGAEIDLLVFAHGLATVAWDRTTGGDEDNDQLYASLSYRF
jgi:hypothetical protein